MTKGFVKLYREWFDHPVINKDNDHWMVWCYLCIHATHTEIPMMFKGEMVILKPGQLITGRFVISERCRVQESKVRRILIEFEKYHLIDRQRSNKNSLITILTTDSEKESDHQNDQPVTNEWTAGDHQVTTNKNDKNVKNVKNNRNSWRSHPNKFVNFTPTLEADYGALYDMVKARQDAKQEERTSAL